MKMLINLNLGKLRASESHSNLLEPDPKMIAFFLKDPCFSDPYFSKFSPAARKKVRLRRARFPHLFFTFAYAKIGYPVFFSLRMRDGHSKNDRIPGALDL